MQWSTVSCFLRLLFHISTTSRPVTRADIELLLSYKYKMYQSTIRYCNEWLVVRGFSVGVLILSADLYILLRFVLDCTWVASLFGVHTAEHGKCKLAFSAQRRTLFSTLPPWEYVLVNRKALPRILLWRDQGVAIMPLLIWVEK
jgi:hypothetical protein